MKRKHHELLAWQVAMQLVELIYQATRNFPTDERYGLRNQMRRAAVSVPSNIAEGAGRSTSKEFLQFLSIARGSLCEVETQLLLAKKLNYADEAQEAEQVMERLFGLLSGLMNSIKRKVTP